MLNKNQMAHWQKAGKKKLAYTAYFAVCYPKYKLQDLA